MKTNRLFLCLAAAPLLLPLASGCKFLHAPAPEPTPTPVAKPKAPFFDPAAGQTPGRVINKAGDPVLPDAFRISSAVTGDRIAIQSVDTVQAGSPPRAVITLGTPDTVRLAGIVAPTVEPGLQDARNAIANWTAGQNVDVQLDSKYPTDIEGVRLTQVIFKGRKGPYDGQPLSLNRMLVRSGNAVVDLYSPTSFDTPQWLLDEAYAKHHKLGFWKYGIAIQQRVPIKLGPIRGSKSVVTIQPTTRAPMPRSAVTHSAVTRSAVTRSSISVPAKTTQTRSSTSSTTSSIQTTAQGTAGPAASVASGSTAPSTSSAPPASAPPASAPSTSAHPMSASPAGTSPSR